MADNIQIKDATAATITIRTKDDGTGKQFNQSVPTDIQGNVAAVTSNAQAARTTDGALVIALSPNSPIPANTDKKVIGAVSIADSSLVVGTHAVTQSGTWAVNAALTSTNNNVAITSVGTNPIAIGTGAAATAIRIALSPNVDKTLVGLVSLGDGIIANSGGTLAAQNLLIGGEVSTGTPVFAAKVQAPLQMDTGGNLKVNVVAGGAGGGAVTQSGVWNVNAALTSTNNNVALTSVGTNPVAIGTGAAATALRIALSPNVDKTLVGMVSLGDGILALPNGTLAVNSVLMGAEVSTAAQTYTASKQGNLQLDTSGNLKVNVVSGGAGGGNVAITSVATSPVAVGTGTAATALRVAIAPNTDKTVIGAVSIADGSIVVGTHAVTQSGTWNVNAALTSTNNNVALTSTGSNPLAVGTGAAATAIRIAMSPNVDKTLIGMVSLGDGILALPNGTLAVNSVLMGAEVSTAAQTYTGSKQGNLQLDTSGNLKVNAVTGTFTATQSGVWNVGLNAGTNAFGKLSANTDKVVIGAVSIADSSIVVGTHAVTQSGTWNVNAALTSTNNNVALTSIGTAPVATGTGNTTGVLRIVLAGNNTDKTIIGAVCIADSTIATTGGGGGGSTAVVSVAGAVTVQAVQIAGSDGANARIPLTDTDGTVKTAGFISTPAYLFTRPADTAVYASGDLIANNTAAGFVTPMSWPVGRLSGGTFAIRRARLKKSTTGTTNSAYRIHVFTTATGVSNANGDNGVWNPTPASKYVGSLDVLVDKAFGDGAVGIAVPSQGNELTFKLIAGQTSISGFLEARAAYTPGNAETWLTTLEIYQN